MVMELSSQRVTINSAINNINNNNSNAPKEFKLVVVGPRKVGKSALVVRFLTKRFINEYLENTDMTCRGMVDVDGETLKINIQDTSDKGMKFSSVDHHFKWADAIMLVYSITDADSYQQLKNTATKMMDKILDLDERESSRIPPLIVVGNKGDLDYVRKVSKQDGFELAELLRCDFFEASAREGWSKLLSRDTSYNTSPCSENETLNAFVGTASVIGMVTAQHRSTTPPPALSKRVTDKCHRNSKENHEEHGLKKWGSFRSVRKNKGHSRSQSTVEATDTDLRRLPRINISESVSSSPSLSEESDENAKKSSSFLAPPKSRKSRHGIMGKLSPRLSRKFHKPHHCFFSKDDNNNNNNNKHSKGNSIMTGLSSSLMMSTRLTDTMSTERTTSSSTSSTDSVQDCDGETNAYNPIRRKSLPHTGLTTFHKPSPLIKNKDLLSGYKCHSNNNPQMINVERTFCSALHSPHEVKLQEHECSGSEPFLHLCRDGKFFKGRLRARSPSNLLRNGFKRIKSLAGDQGHHVHQNKQHNGLSLAVPTIKLS